MAKYYIKTGTLEIIFSTDKEPYDACRTAIHECNSNDEVDEYMYVDERGYRDYTSADTNTYVVDTEQILRQVRYKLYSLQIRNPMMLAEQLSMNAIPMMRLMSICIVMSVGTGTILLLTQPRL